MTLAVTLDRLSLASDALAAAFAAARVTVCEDQPPDAATLAVDELAEAMVELAGEAETLRDRIRSVVLGAVEPERDQALALTALAQQVFNDLSDGLGSRVASCERLAEVDRAARRGGTQWRAWWSASSHGLSECEPALRDLRDALFACWRELAESNGRPSNPATVGAGPTPAGSVAPVGMTANGDLSAQIVFRRFGEEPRGG